MFLTRYNLISNTVAKPNYKYRFKLSNREKYHLYNYAIGNRNEKLAKAVKNNDIQMIIRLENGKFDILLYAGNYKIEKQDIKDYKIIGTIWIIGNKEFEEFIKEVEKQDETIFIEEDYNVENSTKSYNILVENFMLDIIIKAPLYFFQINSDNNYRVFYDIENNKIKKIELIENQYIEKLMELNDTTFIINLNFRELEKINFEMLTDFVRWNYEENYLKLI